MFHHRFTQLMLAARLLLSVLVLLAAILAGVAWLGV